MDKTKIFYSSEIDYSKKTDEELVEIIKTGDKLAANYIIDRYKNLVNIKVSKYSGTEVKYEGTEYLIVKQDDILAIVE